MKTLVSFFTIVFLGAVLSGCTTGTITLRQTSLSRGDELAIERCVEREIGKFGTNHSLDQVEYRGVTVTRVQATQLMCQERQGAFRSLEAENLRRFDRALDERLEAKRRRAEAERNYFLSLTPEQRCEVDPTWSPWRCEQYFNLKEKARKRR